MKSRERIDDALRKLLLSIEDKKEKKILRTKRPCETCVAA
jgi:hypothetical protein